MNEIMKTPATIKREQVKKQVSILNNLGTQGARMMIHEDQTGRREVIIGLADMQQANILTRDGVIGLKLDAADVAFNKPNGTLIVDLSNAGNLRGRVDRQKKKRTIALGDDGMGAMQINKRTTLWVHVSQEK